MKYPVILVFGFLILQGCDKYSIEALKKYERDHIIQYTNAGRFREDTTAIDLDFDGLPLKKRWFNALANIGHYPSTPWYTLSRVDPNYHPTCLSEPLLPSQKRRAQQNLANYIVSDFVKNLHHSVLYSQVGNHGISLTPVAVRKASLKSDTIPTLSIYPDFYVDQNKAPKPILTSDVAITTYEADDIFLLRGVITDKTFPIRCFDVIWSPWEGKPFYGQLYYYDGKEIKSSVFKPNKPV